MAGCCRLGLMTEELLVRTGPDPEQSDDIPESGRCDETERTVEQP
jgi:hypothetical protein